MVSLMRFVQPGMFSLLGAAASFALMAPLAAAEIPGATRTLLAQAELNELGIAAGEALMAEAEAAIDAQNYDLAISKLQTARESLNQTSVSYQDIAAAFTGIDADISVV